MATFLVSVIDQNTNEALPSANIVFVDSDNQPITLNGQPVVFQTDNGGRATFTNGNAAVAVRISYVGYETLYVTLQPGNNDIKLKSNATLPTATITAQAGTFFSKNKTIIVILTLLALAYLAWKYKVIAL